MTSENVSAPNVTTGSSDYDDSYYNDTHLGHHGDYDWSSDHWRSFFRGVAQRIVGLLSPATVLDVGCAKGMLVQALAEQGVDARGSDISDYAVAAAHPEVRDRLFVQSATEPIEGRFDLITCVEVLEHMSPEDAQRAIDSMCAASNRILFSSTPSDFEESTHVNVHPTAQWAAWFAERGYFRRTDADTNFLTPWAILFERADLSPRVVVERYETQLAPLNREVVDKRQALLEANRRLGELAKSTRSVSPLEDARLAAVHADLTATDHLLGLEATIARQERELEEVRARLRAVRARAAKLRARLQGLEKDAEALRASTTWKVGRAITGLGGMRR
ncbi:MAG: class I SAM-dependent methyltransferase [Nocardioides sp.]|uniref:class I SAM-dependent methyltransferase n=1 Tax=Nocardioides sp. TaxID=35761 RepID=UPI0039E25659